MVGIFTDPWMVDFYGFHVGKYTGPMDPMGYISQMGGSVFHCDESHGLTFPSVKKSPTKQTNGWKK